MIELLRHIEINVFHILNGTIANPVFDRIMPIITNGENWLLVYVFLIGWLIWKGGKNGRYCAIVIILTIAIVDQVNSSIIKEFVGRLRPCRGVPDVRLLIGCGPGKSFPSSHAANTFAAAYVLTQYLRHYKNVFYACAIVVSFSRVYVGVHYFSDILGGALLGTAIAYMIVFVFKRYVEKQTIKE